MSIEKLQRVMWRLRKRNPGRDKILNMQLELVIMQEIGTSPDTYRNNRKALKRLGWIKSYNNKYIILTNIDLSEA